MQLEDKAVLVTGASRGLGRALFAAFAEAGARVVGVARNPEEIERVAAELSERGRSAHALAADVADKHATHAIAGAAAALVGPIDVLVHNASTLGPTPLPLLLDTECEDFAQVLELNLLGPFRLSKAIIGSMLLRGAGLVLHVSSDAAVLPYPRWGAYGVSKAALDHLGRIWAAELEGSGVRTLSIDPGEMDTDMHRAALPDADPTALARPGDVARWIVGRVREAERLPSGSRLSAGHEAAA
jgi:NAD(P)-dependent dehydrogenase (short-subunit alcohol dehydrogenase family)